MSPTPDYAETSREPAEVPGRAAVAVEARAGADTAAGKNPFISWAARSDVGLVRSHNEDSFLLRTPLFAVCDGMGGHAAGEVASAIAVETIGAATAHDADDTQLGAAVEEANRAIIQAVAEGRGKEGMGCTASAVLVQGNRMAVAHVGDSRVYLLHQGSLVRVTHDHSYVEELVDAGQITADEARVHPSRSVITRALGSDPDMYADHFTLEVENGDRIILCSDGLSSMVPDSDIEALAVSSATPKGAVDNLVAAALTAGGSDNVTVLVVDVLNDGEAAKHRKAFARRALATFAAVVAIVAVAALVLWNIARSQYYLGNNDGTVGIYQGIPGEFMGVSPSELLEVTTVEVDDLPDAIQEQLSRGIPFSSEEEAHEAVESYRDQIDAEKTKAGETAATVTGESDGTISATDVSPEDAADEEAVSPDASSGSQGTGSDSADAQPADGASGTEGGE